MDFEKTINDIIPTMKSGAGFFSAFVNPVWADDYATPASLDIFYAMTYGDKHPAPILNMFIDDDTGVISSEDVNAIAAMLYQLRGQEWSKLYDGLKAEYNPVENTDVTETETETTTGSGTTGNTRTLNTSKADTGSSSVTSSGQGSGSTANNKYGFDSSEPVGDTTGSDSSTTSSSTTTNSSDTVLDTGTITDAGSHSDNGSLTRNFRKHGNIGTMTAADLIGGNIELWKWTFIIQIMEDISNLTSLSVY